MTIRSRLNDPNEIPNVLGSFTDIQHDASYAHALVQAMDEWEANPEDWDSHYKNATLRIRKRAAEIMRGFGYTEEDDGRVNN